MAMSSAYLSVVANAGATAITHLGLVDEAGNEISGGSYARQTVSWNVTGGVARPTADRTFSVPSGNTVAGWRGYSALTSGTNYGGEDLTPQEYAVDGQYVLVASSTSVAHTSNGS